MNTSILLIITGILNAPAIVALINKLLSRGKDKVDEEVTIGGEWQKYALQAKKDKEEMVRLFEKLKTEHAIEMDELRKELLGKNDRIGFLEERVEALEAELERYQALEKK